MRDGAIVCNSGHFNVEMDLEALEKLARSQAPGARVRRGVHSGDGRKIYVLGEGRLINLSAAEGHPASVMDMSFANQALAVEYMVANHARLEKRVYPVPKALDEKVAKMKLAAMGARSMC